MRALVFMLPLIALAAWRFVSRGQDANSGAPGGDAAPGPAANDAGALVGILDFPGEVVRSIKAGARRIFQIPARGAPYADAINQAEQAHGLPESLLARVLWQESRFNPNAKSPAGAQGIAQFMPGTARQMGIDPWNPKQAIDGAARYLASLYQQFGDWRLALAAYNWGPGNVQRKGINNAPAETVAYVEQITRDVEV